MPRFLVLVTGLLLGGCFGGDDAEPGVGLAETTTRTYYVAAKAVDWNYAPSGRDLAFDQPLPQPWGNKLVYPKLQYVEYTDDTFQTKKPVPAWRGILGPMLRARVGDKIDVVFFNDTDQPLSMHPHGVRYTPENEGARYQPGGDARGVVPPHQKHTYHWFADEGSGPTADEPSSKVWLYHSHVMGDEEIYRGLVGTIVVTDPARANADATPRDVDRELTTLFMVFNENMEGEHDHMEPSEEEQEGNLKHSINGTIFANLAGLDLEQHKRTRWYVVDLGTEVDLHTPHWHGETVVDEEGHSTDVIELLPASMRVVDMTPDNPGSWLFHCHVADHMMAGMYAIYTVH